MMETTASPAAPVFVFPGQGSQYPGMGRDLAACGPVARELAARAETATGLAVWELMHRADAAALADPEVAQVLVFVAGAAHWRAFTERGCRPAAVAGHSLGEYTALLAAGCLDWEQALSLVHTRGKAMARAARRTPGAMAAIVGIPAERLEQMCRQVADRSGQTVVIANHNTHRQLVVSGHAEAVELLIAQARDAGALRARRLPVGGAYHSPLMEPAEREMASALDRVRLRPPRLPLVSSVTGRQVTDIDAYRDVLRGQITAPVRWDRCVAALLEHGARTFIETGPGRVLTGLGRELARQAKHHSAQQALRMPDLWRPARQGTAPPLGGGRPGTTPFSTMEARR